MMMSGSFSFCLLFQHSHYLLSLFYKTATIPVQGPHPHTMDGLHFLELEKAHTEGENQ
jgi:hypothetical protein